MSGHSKWHSIKHKKGATDAKRGALFTKLGNAITIAARGGGGDPEMNFSLRLAIEKAKQSNMPKENIERATQRGAGELAGAVIEEIIYEGFGPGKVALLIQSLTDNKNRTVSEIKNILEKNGGSLAGPGAVMWMFEKRGVITLNKEKVNHNEELELKLIEAGAEDIENTEEQIIIYTKPEDLKTVKENLDSMGIEVKEAQLELVPKEKIEVDDELGQKLQNLFEALDEHGDINDYYSNIK